MAPGKRNLRPRGPRNETTAARRSSLQVNLSFVSSLSDSGNGSLKSPLQSHEFTVPGKVHKKQKVKMSNIPETDNSAIEVDDGALNMIRTKEQALNHSCQLLKDAILNKTREIFDQRAELSVRTNSVLQGQRSALKEINRGSGSVNPPKKSVSSIKESTLTSPMSKSISAAKGCVSGKKIVNKSMARISKGDESIILSGSNKSHRQSLPKFNDRVLRVRLTRLADPRLDVSADSSQSSQSSILDDIGAPMTCSSFISVSRNPGSRASQRAESEDQEDDEDPDGEAKLSPETLTPMEITAVQVPVCLKTKNLSRDKGVSSSVGKDVEKTKDQSLLSPMEFTTVQSHIPFCESARTNKTVRTSLNISTLAHASSGGAGTRISEEGTRVNGTNNSLQVNTSLETQERSPVQQSVRSSDGKSRLSIVSVDGDDYAKNSTDPLENMSLLARLRNISAKKGQPADGRKSGGTNRPSLGPSFIEGTPYPPSRSVLWRTQLKLEIANTMSNKTASKQACPVATATKSSKVSDSDSEAYLTPDETVVLSDSPCRFEPSFGATQIIPDSSDDDEPMETAETGAKVTEERLNKPREELSEGIVKSVSMEVLQKDPKDLSMDNTRSLIIPDSSGEDEFMEVATTSGKVTEEPPVERQRDSSARIVKSRSMEASKNDPKNLSSTDVRSQIIPDSSEEDAPMEKAPSVTVPKKPSNEFLPQPQKSLSLKSLSLDLSKRISLGLPNENASVNNSRTGRRKLLPLHENLELVSFSPVSPAVSSPRKPIIRKARKRLQKRKAVRAIAAKRIESQRQDDDDEREPSCSHISKILTPKEKEKKKKPRKIISKKIVVKKILGMEMMEELEALRRNDSERDSPAGRNSLNDFVKKKPIPISGRNTKSQKLVIVATGFTKGDVDLVKSIVKELGGAEISSTVSRRTTHVVSTGVRTINLLRGIIRGCWLVSLEWALKSLEKRKWLSAERYEMVHFSKAVQENRRDRQLFGKAYVPELFTTCGPIYVEHGTTPPADILKELIKTAGGRIAENVKNSKLIVGADDLKEIWVLDSITTGDLQPIADYKRK